MDCPFGRTEAGKGRKKNTCGKKKLMPQLGNEPLPFACEESVLTTEQPSLALPTLYLPFSLAFPTLYLHFMWGRGGGGGGGEGKGLVTLASTSCPDKIVAQSDCSQWRIQ